MCTFYRVYMSQKSNIRFGDTLRFRSSGPVDSCRAPSQPCNLVQEHVLTKCELMK